MHIYADIDRYWQVGRLNVDSLSDSPKRENAEANRLNRVTSYDRKQSVECKNGDGAESLL